MGWGLQSTQGDESPIHRQCDQLHPKREIEVLAGEARTRTRWLGGHLVIPATLAQAGKSVSPAAVGFSDEGGKTLGLVAKVE